MPDLTPITREEMFLDGNTELTPITREEKILAGEDIDVITRREWFLKKYRGGGDITIEPITITENGTTTAPSGKAYSPIYTNVGLPENAYLLKDFENVPSDIVTFNDGASLPMPSLKTTIVPIQEGSGDPSPSNVRPISGWTEANVTVADDVDNPTVTHTYTIPFKDSQGNPIEVFGGELDVVNGGEQPNPLKKVVFDGSNDEDWRHYGGNRVTVVVDDFTSPASGVTANIMCDKLKTITKSQQGGTEYVISGSDEGYHQFMVNVGISDITELRTWLSNNPITVVYELSTPTTFNSQPTSIKSLLGSNNVWADCGQISEGSYFAKGEEE